MAVILTALCMAGLFLHALNNSLKELMFGLLPQSQNLRYGLISDSICPLVCNASVCVWVCGPAIQWKPVHGVSPYICVRKCKYMWTLLVC